MFVYKQHHYYVYITTTPERTVLYIGMTNDLPQRLAEHGENRGQARTFAGKYYCFNLIYFEYFPYVINAQQREKEQKGWRREKKIDLIKAKYPDWTFLNKSVCKEWPPKKVIRRY
ncbi:MAG: GIY-YIG nuclease family protein [Bacteroidetes bacterium]|nr:GIY-YIG nuclease family protein [Bacteroidota bacterium]